MRWVLALGLLITLCVSADAATVLMLAGHQIVDGGFEIGLSDISFGKGDAKPAVIANDRLAPRHQRVGDPQTTG